MKLPEIEITLKYKGVLQSELKKIASSKDCEAIFRLLFDGGKIEFTEEMILLCLNRANKVIGYYKLSSGGTCGTICDSKVVFTIALKSAASFIIIAHNHPSGNEQPSEADITLTRRLKQAGELLDIKLLDHLIITSETYYSMSDMGKI
jgi:DNA repair protein RadC